MVMWGKVGPGRGHRVPGLEAGPELEKPQEPQLQAGGPKALAGEHPRLWQGCGLTGHEATRDPSALEVMTLRHGHRTQSHGAARPDIGVALCVNLWFPDGFSTQTLGASSLHLSEADGATGKAP